MASVLQEQGLPGPGVGGGDFTQDFDKSGLRSDTTQIVFKRVDVVFQRKLIAVSSEYQVKRQASFMKHLNPIYLPKPIVFQGPAINLVLSFGPLCGHSIAFASSSSVYPPILDILL